METVVPPMVEHGGTLVTVTSEQAYTINDNALGLQRCDPFALFMSVAIAIAQVKTREMGK